jgi:two-component system KDP operon response regulator KdpE
MENRGYGREANGNRAAKLPVEANVAEKLLLIDDDPFFCQLLQMTLSDMGFQVEVAHDAIAGLRKAYATVPDLVLLDIMLPTMDGWEACRRFREMSNVPIIILSALDSTEHVVRGLDLGADCYLVKPVTAEELTARIRAVLRRSTASKLNSNGRQSIFSFRQLVIDYDRRLVTTDGKRVGLTPTEFRLLSVLARHKGRVLSHSFLLLEVWGPDYVGHMDTLHLYISYLRHKIEKNPSKPRLIFNERGIGYRFG